jgi:hypothetical protein
LTFTAGFLLGTTFGTCLGALILAALGVAKPNADDSTVAEFGDCLRSEQSLKQF